MKKLYKIMLAAFIVSLSFIPLSVPVHASTSNTIPSGLSSIQRSYVNQYLYNQEGYFNLALSYNVNGNMYVLFDFEFDKSTRLLTYTNYYRISQNGTISFLTGSYTTNIDTNENSTYFYLKYHNEVIVSNDSSGSPSLFPVSMNFSVNYTSKYVDTEYYNTRYEYSGIFDSFDVDLNAILQCKDWVNTSSGSYCETYNFESNLYPYNVGHLVFPSIYFDGQITNVNQVYTFESVDYLITIEILFDGYYTGYFSGSFPSNFICSDGAIISNNQLKFVDVSKITLTYSGNTTSSIIEPYFLISGITLNPSDGQPVSDKVTHDLLDSGNSSSQSSTSSINSTTSSLNSSASQYESFESQFNSSLTSSLDNIDVNSINLVNSNDFVKTASWVKVQFDDILDNSGIYKTAISFVLIIGLALLLLGRRL